MVSAPKQQPNTYLHEARGPLLKASKAADFSPRFFLFFIFSFSFLCCKVTDAHQPWDPQRQGASFSWGKLGNGLRGRLALARARRRTGVPLQEFSPWNAKKLIPEGLFFDCRFWSPFDPQKLITLGINDQKNFSLERYRRPKKI